MAKFNLSSNKDDLFKYLIEDIEILIDKINSLVDIKDLDKYKGKEPDIIKDVPDIENILKANDYKGKSNTEAISILDQIATIKYDLGQLINGNIKSDSELKAEIEKLNYILSTGALSPRENVIIQEKINEKEKELKKYDIEVTKFENMTPKFNENKPYATVDIGEQKATELEKGDLIEMEILQKSIAASGREFAKNIADSIIPLSKANNIAEQLLNTFTRSVIQLTIMKAVSGAFELGLGGGSGGLSGLFGMNGNIGNNAAGAVPTMNAMQKVQVEIPKVEFKQAGYDMKAVVDKINKVVDKYQ